MTQKALVQVQTVDVTAAQEPRVRAVLLRGRLRVGMEAVTDGLQLVIASLQTLDGTEVNEFSDVHQSVHICITITDPSKLNQLKGLRLTFSLNRSIPVADIIHPWQIEPTT